MSVTDEHFNPSGLGSVDAIKKAANEFEKTILEHSPAGRRQALALTHLETCAMFAVKAAVVGDA